MRIEKTSDRSYPLKFDDTWGDGAYLTREVVMDDKKWEEFLAELNKIRNEIKKGA